jgi:menaquinone-dependent protoporphyrinogen IX oxidase
MSEKILIAYSTYSGSTEDVAREIAAELGKAGRTAEALPISTVTSLDGYSAAVIGGPMILGWHREAERFVKAHNADLAKLPVAFFFTAMSLTNPESNPYPFPVFIDPALGKPPHKPGRLSLRERYASVSNYLRPALKAAAPWQPVSVGFFKGRLDLFRLKLRAMLFVMLVIGQKPGDFRNWETIQGWARDLALCLPAPA